MKHFKIVGPLTTREFDIEDDEMLTFSIANVKDFNIQMESFKVSNQKIYENK